MKRNYNGTNKHIIANKNDCAATTSTGLEKQRQGEEEKNDGLLLLCAGAKIMS